MCFHLSTDLIYSCSIFIFFSLFMSKVTNIIYPDYSIRFSIKYLIISILDYQNIFEFESTQISYQQGKGKGLFSGKPGCLKAPPPPT